MSAHTNDTRMVAVRRRGIQGLRLAPTLLAMAILTTPLAPGQAAGQETPRRTHRHLAVGNLSFLNSWDPALHGGYLYQFSIRKTRLERDQYGVEVIVPPRWLAHMSASAGWARDANGNGSDGFSGLGQLGLMYRFDGPFSLNRIGMAAQGSLGPDGIGGVLRAGFLHGNAALSVGWMSFEGPRSDGIVVSLDLLRCILKDLGLVGACLIG
jgi:hypothetical protein